MNQGFYPPTLLPSTTIGGCIDIFENAWVNYKETIEKVSTSKRGGKTIFKGQQAPFLEIANSRPLYAGWDDQCKKLVLTNRFLPRAQAGQELFPFEMKEIKVDDYPTLRSLFKKEIKLIKILR